jgi:hypothetical protein
MYTQYLKLLLTPISRNPLISHMYPSVYVYIINVIVVEGDSYGQQHTMMNTLESNQSNPSHCIFVF